MKNETCFLNVGQALPDNTGSFLRPLREKVHEVGMRGVIARGFTLIELLVVVLIIGILAAVALPQYQMAIMKSRVVSVKPILLAIKEAEEVYYLEHGAYTPVPKQLDLQIPGFSTSSNGFLNQDFYINLLGSQAGNNYVTATYCPGNNKTNSDCNQKSIVLLTFWFTHSNLPNHVECTGITTLGQKICQSM